jgi:uncharacterized protein (TIGR02266 family)
MKVLFVEDSDFYLQFRRGFFSRIGCQILNARSAEQALESIAAEQPELVIVSSRLPDGSGADLCRKIRAAHRNRAPRLVLISEAGEPAAGAAAWNEHLERPINPDGLMDRISALLSVPQRRSRRMSVQMEVTYGSRRDRLRGAALNLSQEGMLIETVEPLPAGAKLEMEFTLPGQEKPLLAQGEVVRATRLAGGRKHGLGVRFLELAPDVQRAVREFLE